MQEFGGTEVEARLPHERRVVFSLRRLLLQRQHAGVGELHEVLIKGGAQHPLGRIELAGRTLFGRTVVEGLERALLLGSRVVGEVVRFSGRPGREKVLQISSAMMCAPGCEVNVRRGETSRHEVVNCRSRVVRRSPSTERLSANLRSRLPKSA